MAHGRTFKREGTARAEGAAPRREPTEKPVGFAVILWRRVFVVPPGDTNGQ